MFHIIEQSDSAICRCSIERAASNIALRFDIFSPQGLASHQSAMFKIAGGPNLTFYNMEHQWNPG
jgi:hypothetical protein